MLVIAHRGYHADVPENTIAAFAAAVALGVDGIETDVQLSADGEPVMIHDRVTLQKRAVAELARRDLERDVGHPVPVLSEALDQFPDVLWNVEIKSLEALPAALAVLKHYVDRRRLFVTSFRHDVVREVARQLPIDCGLLLAHRPLDVGAVIAECGGEARIRAMVWDYNVIDADVLQAVTLAGWRNYVYGAITSAEHERCAGFGLAGLITDYPRYVLHGRSAAGE